MATVGVKEPKRTDLGFWAWCAPSVRER